MIERFSKNQNWARLTPWLGLFSAVILIIFARPKDPMFWALINIPLYLFHQMEEHYRPGGFKKYVNTVVNKLPQGQEMLTDRKVFWINILLVWVAFVIFGALAFVNIGFGLLIIIFSILNCMTHIVTAIRKKQYNPGLVMACIQFVISIYAAYYVTSFGGLTHIALWWVGTVLFSALAHIAVFKVAKI